MHRSRYLRSLASFVLCFALFCSCVPVGGVPHVQAADALLTGDWPMGRHDPARSSSAPWDLAPPLVLLSTISVGARVETPPAVSSDVLVVGDEDGRVRCFDINTGKLRWTAATGAAVRGAPAIYAGRAYAGSDDGYIYAFSLTDGSLVWRFRTGNKVQASLLVADGTVFVGSLDGHFYAIDAEQGTERWDFTAQGRVFGGAALGGGRLIFGDDAGYVYGVEASSGRAAWTRQLGATASGVVESPTLDERNGWVYVGSLNHYLYCLDAASGRDHRPARDLGAPVYSSVALGENVVVASSRMGLFCLERQTGVLKWTYEVSGDMASSCVVMPGYVLASEPRGFLSMIAVGSGEQKWFMDFGEDGGRCSPVVALGVVFLAKPSGNILAFTTERSLAVPTLSVSPMRLDLGTAARGAALASPLYVSNGHRDALTGAIIGSLEGSVTTDAPWLSVSPRSFSGNAVTLTVKADTSGMSPGSSAVGHVTISSNGGSLAVPVAVAVERAAPTVITLYIGSATAYVNGVAQVLDAPPIIDSRTGRTLVPLRFIAEAAGAAVTWNAATRTVRVTAEGVEIVLVVGDRTARVNGESRTLDQPAVILGGRTLVPLRFVAEALGGDVAWNGAKREIVITFRPQG